LQVEEAPTIAVRALWYHPVHRQTSLRKASCVVLWTLWPAFGELGTTWLGRELDADNVLLILLALEVDDRVSVGDFLLLGNKMCVHLGITENLLELFERDFREGLSVREDGLNQC